MKEIGAGPPPDPFDALLSETSDRSVDPAELDEQALWEEQVREQLRRDIEARERAMWQTQPASPALPATRLRAPSPGLSAPDAPAARRFVGVRTPFAPLADARERASLTPAGGDYTAATLDALRRRARIAETTNPAEARALLEQLARLVPGDPEVWHQLFVARAATDNRLGAEVALRTSLALGRARPDRSAQLEALRGERTVARVGSATSAAGAAAAADTARDPLSWSERLIPWSESLMERVPTPLREQLTAVVASENRGRVGLAALAVLLLLGAARILRQRGDLAINIHYPAELRGTFRVRLDRRRGRWRRVRPRSDSDLLKGGTSVARHHFHVGRETKFRRLATRRYYVSVDGVLQDPKGGEVLVHPFAQDVANVLNRRTVRLDFDVSPEHGAVDVSVRWNDQPARGAAVAVRGRPDTYREVHGASARISLPRGRHIVAAGSGDRVAETAIEIRSFLPTPLSIDLASSPELVFKACPPAVEPYLLGDFRAAARALERDGQAARAHLLLARRHRELGELAPAAEHFESAGEWLEAAEIRTDTGDHARAAALFEKAGDLLSAAETYHLAGDEVRAGEAFEAARDFDSAIECYRRAGDIGRWIETLERRGDTFEAAQIALEHELEPRATRLLQRLGPESPDFAEACLMLTDVFERERHWDLAARKLDEYIDARRPGEIPSVVYSRLAELHEKSGHVEQALEVLESLRQRDPTFPHVATRAERLRKARSAKQHAEAHALEGDGSGLAPTILLADQRYQILGEIGRGGMGVVLRARDRRLGRVVALKRLSESLRDYPRAVQLFLREAQSAAALNHPNIVTVYDADQENGSLFITMELLEGAPLNAVLKRQQRLDVPTLIDIGSQVASGLEYAHARRVIHRDIKTANLFLTSEGTAKIMDFGLAKLLEEVRRSASIIGGTPYYMSPEQTVGGEVDHRADLYALGITLFELATGRVPFPEGDVAYHNRHTPAPDPREFAPDLGAPLAELILDLLRKEPDDRPDSAADVRIRLQQSS